MRENLVSVIMPMHNSAEFLSAAIDTVLNQSYTDWELLIVDDNSVDDSVDIALQYAKQDSRIHVLKNEAHTGMPSTPRNVGILAARGRFIAFLDSDDMWFSTKLEQQIPLFQEDRVAIVYGNYEKVNEQGIRNNRYVKAPSLASYEMLLKGNVIGNLTAIYDRKKTGTVLMQDKHHEDYIMWLSILKGGFIAKNTNTIIGSYRVRESSVSSKKLETAKWQWAVYRDVEKLSLLHSAYNFIFYAYKAYVKSLI